MTVRFVSVRRLAMPLVKIALLAAALLTGAATQAFAAGSISGRVTGSNAPGGLQGTVIQVFNLTTNDNAPSAIATTDASGNYSANLPAGTYVAFTQDIHGYINEIWNNLPCSAVCNITNDDILANAIVVTDSAITGINFVLDPGGRISGHVSSSVAGNPPIAGIVVNFTDPSGDFPFTKGVTDSSGNFITEGGTATGSVRAYTSSTLPYQDEIYDNIKFATGDVTTGTAIAVTQAGGATGVDFILDAGGQISGTVRDAGGAPLANIEVDIINSTGNFDGWVLTDASGNYITAGLAAGSYYLNTHSRIGLVDQLYNGVTCVNGFCGNPTLLGTAIPVTVPGITPGINFTLSPGGTVSGTVTNAVGGAPVEDVFVQFFTVSTTPGPTFGLPIFEGGGPTNSSGQYNAVLPPGTHNAAITNEFGYVNQLYNNLPCPDNCLAQNGTPIVVSTGATTGNVNFSLSSGAPGTISGTVTNAVGGTNLSGIVVQLFSNLGTTLGISTTNGSGFYTFTGLAPGSYYVRTNTNNANFINQLYNGVVCINCPVTTSGGTLIPVTSGATTTINFSLASGARITGTITNASTLATITGIPVQVYSSTGVLLQTANTNASGLYATPALPPGNYYIRTAVTPAQNFLDLLWNGRLCVPCGVTTGDLVVLGTTNTGFISMALSGGGTLSGTVTDASAGGAPVPAMPIVVFTATGVVVKTTTTDASGNYSVAGLPTGNYYVRTNPNALTQNYVTQTYNAMPFNGNATTGTPVDVTIGATHNGVNFALVSGGNLSGRVTAAGTGDPLGQVQVTVYLPTGKFVKNTTTDPGGSFTVRGLQAGNYYVSTSTPSFQTPFYVDELFDNLACVGCQTIGGSAFPLVTLPCTSCATAASGTAVTITNGTTRTGVDFVLASGAGVISGAVTSAATGVGLVNVQVSVYNGAGQVVKSVTTAQNTGAYLVRGLAPGTYFLRTIVSPATPNYTDQAYGGVPCAPCDVTTTTGVLVSANATSTVNFPLSAGGSITGAVTDANTTNPLPSVDVQLYNSTGGLVKTTFTGASGSFTLDGLPAGTYYARTAVPVNLSFYVDELYDNIPCVSCTPTTGTPIAVSNSTTHSSINFALLPKVPTVVTSAATSITQGGATLNGTVNPNGTSTTALFEYGLTTGYGSQATASPVPGSGTSPVAVSAAITGLTCSTPYHFRAVATNPGGTTNGGDLTFTTASCPPVITLVSPNSGQQGQANLNVVITGAFTHFVQGTTTANLGAGITVNSTTVQGATQATANVTIAFSAVVGARTVTVTTGGEVVSLVSGFTVTGATALTGVSPSGGRRGSTNLIVSLTGQGTHFAPGTTTASFGAGITVNSTTVQSATQATANLTIAAAAALGPRTVTVTTGGEVVASSSAFVVTPVTTAPGDFDGDGKSDLTVVRPSNGTWYSLNSSTGTPTGVAWGNASDKPVAGDYDGDGRTDAAVFRPSDGGWYVMNSGTGVATGTLWGNASDSPVPGDYDGDKKTDLAIFRPSSGTWFVVRSSTGVPFGFAWGNAADTPVPGDYDGDGKTDIAVFRPSSGTWFVVPTSTGVPYGFAWGNAADKPVAADYDGDGKTDIAIFRPSNGGWYIVPSTTGIPIGIIWGNAADTPVPGDFDGDGKSDIGVFRPSSGTWFAVPSGSGVPFGVVWGNAADYPILKRP